MLCIQAGVGWLLVEDQVARRTATDVCYIGLNLVKHSRMCPDACAKATVSRYSNMNPYTKETNITSTVVFGICSCTKSTQACVSMRLDLAKVMQAITHFIVSNSKPSTSGCEIDANSGYAL